jgi:hypothetical protein
LLTFLLLLTTDIIAIAGVLAYYAVIPLITIILAAHPADILAIADNWQHCYCWSPCLFCCHLSHFYNSCYFTLLTFLLLLTTDRIVIAGVLVYSGVIPLITIILAASPCFTLLTFLLLLTTGIIAIAGVLPYSAVIPLITIILAASPNFTLLTFLLLLTTGIIAIAGVLPYSAVIPLITIL